MDVNLTEVLKNYIKNYIKEIDIMGVKIGMVGVGSFSQKFIPLFKNHPLVDEVTLCDINEENMKIQ